MPPRGFTAFLRLTAGLLLLGVVGRPSVVQGQQHLLSSFSLAEGLPQSQVWDIQQDHNGFMWFATFGGGVARFDGNDFEVFTTEQGLASNTVYGLHEDRAGTMWLATRDGVSRWGRDGFLTVPGIPEDVKVYDLTSDGQGRVWAATDQGAFVLTDNSFLPSGPAGGVKVNAITSSSTGQLWLATAGEGLYRLENREWTQFTVDEGLPHNTVLSIGDGPEGHLWFGTEQGVARKDADGFSTFTVADGFSNNRVLSIQLDHDGYLWFGTDLGVTRYDGELFEPLSARTLSSVPVWSIGVDHEGNVYFGTSGRGALFFNHSPFTHLDGGERFDGQTVWNIASDSEGQFWFALEGGLKRFDGKTMAELPVDDGFLGDRSVRALHHDEHGQLWVGTSAGLFRQRSHGGFGEIYAEDGTRIVDVRAIRCGPSGAVWVATLGHGAFRWDGESLEAVPGPVGSELYDVLETSWGDVWFVGGAGADVQTRAGIRRLTEADGLNHQEVIAAVEDRFGRVWLGSYGGGLNMLNGPVVFGTPPAFDSITTADGLTNNTVLFLALDGNDGLWVGTNRGLNRIDVAAYDSTGNAPVQRFGEYEGFIGVEANLHGAYRDPTGAMWFGHVDGVSRIASGVEEQVPPHVPILQLTGVRLFLDQTDWRVETEGEVTSLGLPLGLSLNHDKNHLTFDFVGLSYRSADRVLYRHRLVGFDKTWSPIDDQRSITYSNLAPGSYSFQVQASLDGLQWGSNREGFGFEIQKAFWQEWWFVLVSSLAWLAGLIGTFSYRTRALRRSRRHLESVVAERTADLTEAREAALQAARAKGQFLANMSHEIRTPMNGVLGFARLLAETDLQGEQKEFVDVITSSGDSLLAIINDILDFSKMEAGKALLDTDSFSVRRLVERVLDLMSASAGEKEIELVADIAPEIPESLVGDEPKVQQILVNLVSNALKFTHDGEVVLKAEVILSDQDEATIRFAVQDTGIGIPSDRLEGLFAPFTQADASTTRKYGGTGLGLSISDRLCRLMGGDLAVESEEGVGSTFHFELVLPFGDAKPISEPEGWEDLQERRFLVVDSSSSTANALASQLRHWGANVTALRSWPEAEALVRAGERVDVVLVDLDIPELNGQYPRLKFADMFDGHVPRFICLRSVGRRPECARCVIGLAKPVKRRTLREAVQSALHRDQTDRTCVGKTASAESSAALNVLVAEDNSVNRKLIGRLLDRMGHNAEMVANGEEAVLAVSAGSFDVVLMDIQMPVLDGLGAAKMIQDDILASVRPAVVALTAAVSKADRDRCKEVGMERVLAKPISVTALAEVLDDIREKRDQKALEGPTLGGDRVAIQRPTAGSTSIACPNPSTSPGSTPGPSPKPGPRD